MDMDFKQIDPQDLRPLRDIVFENLRNAIFEGKIKSGDRLVESVIAEKMQVSRTPVREALRKLESEDLAVNVPRKGTVVAGIAKEDAIEIYDIREVLEGLVSRLACQYITDEDIVELNAILSKMEVNIKASQDDKLMKINYEYNMLHNEYNGIILRNCGSKHLEAMMMKNVYDYLYRLRNLSLYKSDRRVIALKEHKEIVKALKRRDGDATEILVRNHVKKAKEAFLNNA